jgi:hypothetical protein
MANYKIVGLANNNITLEYDGIQRNFPLPIVDGLYPVGDELTTLLDAYITHQRESSTVTNPTATNEADVLALVEASVITTEMSSNKVKTKRNQLLQRTDYTQANDSPFSAEDKASWAIYRTALRGLPEQAGYPASIVWPIPPFAVIGMAGLALTDVNGVPAGLGN